jgi:hypothetical protein
MISLEQLLSRPREFLMVFSAYYPIPKYLLKKYKSVWKWKYVSQNTFIEWNEDLLEQFEEYWEWKYGGLSNNEALPWSIELLEKFRHRWSWIGLKDNGAIMNEQDMLKAYLNHWGNTDQKKIFEGFMAPFNEANHIWIETLFEQWADLDWKYFSSYRQFPWTPEFIRKNAEKFNWQTMSRNPGLPWSIDFIKEHITQWDWRNLSLNRNLPWSLELLETFADKWDWEILGDNERVEWSTEILMQFKHKIHWAYAYSFPNPVEGVAGVINSPSYYWTPALFKECRKSVKGFFKKLVKKHKDDFAMDETYWTYFQNGCNWTVDYLHLLVQLQKEANSSNNMSLRKKDFIAWHRISREGKGIWSEEVINLYKDEWDTYELARNPHFPWNDFLYKFADQDHIWSNISTLSNLVLFETLLDAYKNRWDWKALSSNPTLTPDMIDSHKEKWDWEKLSANKSITQDIIEKYDRWDWWQLMKVEANPNSPYFIGPYYDFRDPNKRKLSIEKFVSIDLLERFLACISKG